MQQVTTFAPALPHGPIEEVFRDVFVVRGAFRMMPLMTFARNMTIVRQGAELTLINSVRLSAEGEAALEKLGSVRHLVRLGMAHGSDDPYYVSRYRPTLWAPPGTRHFGELRSDRELTDEGASPIDDARPFVFADGNGAEGALVMEREGGVLVTCDAVQNHVDFEGSSAMAVLAMRMMGFAGPAKIGPPWRKRMEKGGRSLANDFRRLAALRFRHLLSGHGAPLRDGAHEAVAATVAATYGEDVGSRARA